MRVILVLAATLAQDQPLQQLPPSPVQRIVVSPAPATMTAQDTLRLSARALDANGREVPGVVSASVIDAASGKELARIPTMRTVVHGVAISDDDRYAFVSVEGYGAQPGTVEVIDLRSREKVASVDVGQMAGGIDFWHSEPTR